MLRFCGSPDTNYTVTTLELHWNGSCAFVSVLFLSAGAFKVGYTTYSQNGVRWSCETNQIRCRMPCSRCLGALFSSLYECPITGHYTVSIYARRRMLTESNRFGPKSFFKFRFEAKQHENTLSPSKSLWTRVNFKYKNAFCCDGLKILQPCFLLSGPIFRCSRGSFCTIFFWKMRKQIEPGILFELLLKYQTQTELKSKTEEPGRFWNWHDVKINCRNAWPACIQVYFHLFCGFAKVCSIANAINLSTAVNGQTWMFCQTSAEPKQTTAIQRPNDESIMRPGRIKRAVTKLSTSVYKVTYL